MKLEYIIAQMFLTYKRKFSVFIEGTGSGAGGKDKQPGEMRKEAVWIGAKGCCIEEAAYAARGAPGLKAHLENLLGFMKLPDQEVTMRTAIMHG